MKILVTGAAGFIGFHLVGALLRRGDEVTGVDNLNDYYEVSLKQARLRQIEGQPRFRFHRLDIADRLAMKELFALEWFDAVANLAAQPGVRHSLVNPSAYVDSNLVGFGNVLEGCRQQQVKHLVFASSSSVYGANNRIPYSEHDAVDHPISLYAATKRANELMAHTYAHLYGLPATGLRFFTVYGPWGRPDMAYFSFTRKILAGETIPLFNRGDMMRDFTYIDDIVEGVVRVMDRAPERSGPGALGSPATALAPFRLYNIGNSQPVALAQFMETLESALGRKAMTELQPMQPGDVEKTCADTTDLERATGFRPRTPIAEGIAKFVAWYRSYYGQ
ncbi:MAG: NAD-dependent epimerase [Betaproteobacteria bacterium]|nr:NAD-dependent epimerase [Betaproteobacteria bacterium]